MLVYTFVVIGVNVRKIGLHDGIAALMFMVIPVIFIGINIVYPDMAFSIAALALSMLVINTMLQAKREKRLIDNEAASSELAHSDEFVVLLPNVSKELFDKKIKMLNEKIAENEIPMISVGNSYGSSGQIEKLIDLAEKNMYEEKEKFHKEHPSYSRL